MSAATDLVPLLRAKDVSAVLGVSVWQVDALRRRGLLTGVSLGERCWRYHPDDVALLIRRRRG